MCKDVSRGKEPEEKELLDLKTEHEKLLKIKPRQEKKKKLT